VASTAEVDLVISTADALPELERDLNAIIRTAENGAPELNVEAALAVGESLSNIAEELEGVIQSAESGASDVEVEAALDAQRSLSHIQGQLESIIRRAEAGDDIDLQAELDQVGSLTQVSNQLRALVHQVEARAPDIEIEVEVDPDGRGVASTVGLGRALRTLIGPGTRVAGVFAGIAATTSSLLPLLAGIATTVEAIAPAAAVAATGMAALALAGGTLALAFNGVGEAISTAFDPEASPEDLAKAMENLAPSAREFVVELQSMRDGFKELQQEIQGTFFTGFADALDELGQTVLPVVADAVRTTAGTLNGMALSAAAAAVNLAQNGTLGRALASANAGLLNLRDAPAAVITALGQLGAAAGPAFERITAAAARAGAGISERLTEAFEDGRLEAAIDSAIDTIAQLGTIAGNVFGGLGNIMDAVSDQGGGLFTSLEKVTQAFEDATASQGFQQALTALLAVGGTLIDTVLPLISQALQVLGPVLTALAPPVQILVRSLGDGLSKILVALEPVLVSVANAFGQLVLLVTPFISLAATLISAILPALVPLFDGLGQAFNAMIPFVEQLVTNIAAQLLPVLTTLATTVLPQLIPPFVELATRLFPILTEALVALAPGLAQIGEAFAQLLVELTPVLVELANLTIQIVDDLMPVVQPLIDVLLRLVNLALKVLAAQITGLVIPTIRILVDLLQGDFRGAWEGAQNLVKNVTDKIVQTLGNLGNQAREKLLQLVQTAIAAFTDLNNRAGAKVRELPGIVLNALGNLGNLLTSAGADIVRGLINGLTSKLGELRSAASKIADTVSGTVGKLLDINSPSRVMRDQGNDTMDGYVLGIADRIPDLRRQLQGVASLAPSFALPGGQTLKLPQLGQQAPTVQVFIGNEQLNSHFDTRIAQNNQARDRLAFQGVRR